jgi:hypothetical protein
MFDPVESLITINLPWLIPVRAAVDKPVEQCRRLRIVAIIGTVLVPVFKYFWKVLDTWRNAYHWSFEYVGIAD